MNLFIRVKAERYDTLLAETATEQSRLSRACSYCLSAIVLLLLWQVVAVIVRHWRGALFPYPLETLATLWHLLFGKPLLDHSLWTHVGASLGRWSIGFSLGCSAALLFGLVCASWRAFERLAMPLVYGMQLVPGLAWIPVALLLFGVTNQAAIFMITVSAFSPLAISFVSGIKAVPPNYLQAAAMSGASSRQLFRYVLLPAAVPHLISGLRVSLGISWRVVVAAEMVVGTGAGLGYSLIETRWTLEYPAAFACVLMIMALGLVVEYGLFARLEAYTARKWGMSR